MPGDEWDRLRAGLLDRDRLRRAVVSGRQRNRQVPFRRVELRYVQLRAGLHLQITAYDATQAHTRNVAVGAPVADAVDELLAEGYANWRAETTDEVLELRVTKRGRPLLHVSSARPLEAAEPAPLLRDHDRPKQHRLDPADPLFELLGIARDGRVKPSRTAKYRQVQDLLAVIDPLIDDAIALGPGAGETGAQPSRPLRVVDLGCGNAYLTFAAHRYLESVRGVPTTVEGIDVLARAREHNAAIADALGISERMTFVESAIATATPVVPPDLLLALHACDTATDDALARAVEWGTPVVVAAPCCHHDIAGQLRAVGPPDRYRLVTRHGILRERLADVLTDALRAALLRLVGYRVDVVEFVDSRHTPRNSLIRAVRTGAPAGPDVWSAYRELRDEWQVVPALETRLRPIVPGLAALD